MMKFVFALVGLLHLCSSIKLNKDLSTEMIHRLEELNKLYNDSKVNITSPETMRVPSRYMNRHVLSCVGVFFGELRHLLDNVMVHEDSKNILQELKANLQAVGTHHRTNSTCPMSSKMGLKPFGTYAGFLRKLNTSMKR